MGLYSRGLIIGRIFTSEIWGAYFRERLLLLLIFLGGGGGGAGGGLLSEFHGILLLSSFSQLLYIKTHFHTSGISFCCCRAAELVYILFIWCIKMPAF